MIHQIDDTHYQTICGWWEKREWPILPRGMVPDLGFIAYVGEKPVIAAWLYKDTTSWVGQIDWIISNPDTTPVERTEGFKELVDHVCQVAKEIGVIYLMTGTNNKNLIQKYKDQGFDERDTEVTYLTKNLY